VDTLGKAPKLPYGKAFETRLRAVLTAVSAEKSHLQISVEIHFVKSVLAKSFIRSGARKTTKEVFEMFAKELRIFLQAQSQAHLSKGSAVVEMSSGSGNSGDDDEGSAATCEEDAEESLAGALEVAVSGALTGRELAVIVEEVGDYKMLVRALKRCMAQARDNVARIESCEREDRVWAEVSAKMELPLQMLQWEHAAVSAIIAVDDISRWLRLVGVALRSNLHFLNSWQCCSTRFYPT
jgi:hypothetical protein